MLDRVTSNGAARLERDDADPDGRFARILDPEGNKVELWEPRRPASP